MYKPRPQQKREQSQLGLIQDYNPKLLRKTYETKASIWKKIFKKVSPRDKYSKMQISHNSVIYPSPFNVSMFYVSNHIINIQSWFRFVNLHYQMAPQRIIRILYPGKVNLQAEGRWGSGFTHNSSNSSLYEFD